MTDLAHRRLRALGLVEPFDVAQPVEVLTRMLAVQSQDFAPSLWSIAQRMPPAHRPRESDLRAAFDRGDVLRTHVLRTTWHIVAPRDLRWLLALTGPRVAVSMRHQDAKQGIDSEVLTRSAAIITSELNGSQARTRAQLQQSFAAHGIEASGIRLAHLLMHAELDGLICSGPMIGRQHSYMLVADRLGPASGLPSKALAAEEVLVARLIERYLAGHGPASLRDIATWSSLTQAQLRAGLEVLGAAIRMERVSDATWLTLAADEPVAPILSKPPDHRDRTMRLLQGYDEYTVGFTQTKWCLDIDGSARAAWDEANNGGPSRFMLILVRGSQVVGNWKRDQSAAEVTVTVRSNTALTQADVRDLRRAVAEHAEFLGRSMLLVTLA